MARLPQPGGDEGVWGQVLNDYLSVAHDTAGTIKTDAVPANAIQDDSVSASKLAADSVTEVKLATSNSPSTGQVLSYNGSSLAWAANGSGDPTLGGDLSGTASNAQIVAGAVGSTELGTNAVTTIKITDSNVTDAKIASGVAQSKITNLTTDLAARVTVANGGGETYFDAGNSGAAKTLDLANGNVQKLTLTANCTITLTSPASGAYRSLLLYVFQDGTGSRTITWPGSVSWGTAGAPTLSTTASRMDKILLDTVDGGTTWYGTAGPGGF